MENHIIRDEIHIKVTHDVLQTKTEKPNGFNFDAAQATEVAINKTL